MLRNKVAETAEIHSHLCEKSDANPLQWTCRDTEFFSAYYCECTNSHIQSCRVSSNIKDIIFYESFFTSSKMSYCWLVPFCRQGAILLYPVHFFTLV